nr:hypothetical protein [uncultured Cohaesibacter sp.]
MLTKDEKNHDWFFWLWPPLCVAIAWSDLNGAIFSDDVRYSLVLLLIFGVSVSVCIFTYSIKPYPPLFGFLYCLVVSIGFHTAFLAHGQQTQENSYSICLLIWSLPVGLNGAIYLVALASSVRHRAGGFMRQKEKKPWYEISLRPISETGKRGREIRHYSGPSPLSEGFSIDGFNQDHYIAFDEYAEVLADKKRDHMSIPVTLYETIEKFGELQQLTYRYELEFQRGNKKVFKTEG